MVHHTPIVLSHHSAEEGVTHYAKVWASTSVAVDNLEDWLQLSYSSDTLRVNTAPSAYIRMIAVWSD